MAKQLDLDFTKARRDQTLPYAKGVDTSRAAASDARPTAGAIRVNIFRAILASQRRGYIADELVAEGLAYSQSASPRLQELRKMGLIVRTKRMRPTRTGKNAYVHVATEFYVPVEDD